MYHSMHENFDWMSKYVDPDFRYHLTVGKMWLKLGLLLADSQILPFNLSRAATKVKYYADKFAKDYNPYLARQGLSAGIACNIYVLSQLILCLITFSTHSPGYGTKLHPI